MELMGTMDTVNVACAYYPGITWDDKSTDDSQAVRLYRISINDHLVNLGQYDMLLCDEETAKAERYNYQKDRDRFVISRAVLRLLLARKLSVHPSTLVFAIGTNKKPFLAEPAIATVEFNLAHAGEYILIAISDSPVGADLEYIDPDFNYPEVAKFACNEDEMSSISASSSPLFTFYMLWSRKESLLKATGKGISDDLPAVRCLDGTNIVQASAIGSTDNWKISSFMVAAGYVGNVATAAGSSIYFSTVKSDQIM
ncbi:4'-phosphopantetheinyl transferase family protein [Flavitalea antarctica]